MESTSPTCPLCRTGLKQHLLQPKLALVACPNEQCVYPFNLSTEELKRQNLIVEVTTGDIMNGMRAKLELAGVNVRIAEFISREDEDL